MFQRQLLDRLNAIPGIEHAVLSTGLPVYSYFNGTNIVIEGQPALERGREPLAHTASISSDYFTTLRIPLVQGAFFPADLKADSPSVAIINETFARRFWPGVSPIGKRLRSVNNEPWLEIVGVVGDVGMAVNFSEPETRLHLYRPLIQAPSHYVAIVVRSAMAPEALVTPVSQAVAAIDSDLPVDHGGSLRREISRNLANFDIIIVNLGTFAVMGLLIASLGLYGVISQLTAQRTRDIGVRIALGAQYRDILRMVLGQGVRLVITGLFAGLPLFFGVNLLLHRAMPEMRLPGWWLLCSAALLLGVTALFACWLPARRAARVNPVDALRAE